ncbi:hypothetical protein HY642_07455 [Candidatus Woesearchaeota archaeon]|nr:hypothetical protein [Candidatus Woesearchaeota archaeon]
MRGSYRFAKLVGSRKAQVTIFIILGILLLLGIVVVLYLQGVRPVFPPELFVPKEAKPVYDAVTGCSKRLAEEAVTIMGNQAGYLTLPDTVAHQPTSYVSMDDAGVMNVPYWYYEGEDRTPTLAGMESEIAIYVKDNLLECVNNFTNFSGVVNVTPIGQLTGNVVIAPDEVVVKIIYPLLVVSPSRTVTVEEFVTRLPVGLGRLWMIANKTLTVENEIEFFENFTVDLMAADKEVPMDGMSFDCSPQRWRIEDVRQRVQRLVKYNLQNVRVKGTKTVPFLEGEAAYEELRKYTLEDIVQGRRPSHVPEDSYEYLRMQLKPGVDAPDVRAAFIYDPAWGMDFNAQPNDAGVLKSNLVRGGRKYLTFMCVNQYHFAYDVIYPVMMLLRDDKAFAGKGFVFRMAFPVLINDNEGERVSYGIRKFEPPPVATEFCENIGDQIADIRVRGLDEEGFEEELTDANITLVCLNRACKLGTTTADEGIYRLRTALPAGCRYPTVHADKEGYMRTTGSLLTDRLELRAARLLRMPYKVLVHPYDLERKEFLEPFEVGESRTASIFLSSRNATWDQFKQWPANDTVDIPDVTAYYDVNIVLTLNNDLVGGYTAEKVLLNRADIAGKQQMVFHVVEVRPIKEGDKYRADVVSYLNTDQYQLQLKPAFE